MCTKKSIVGTLGGVDITKKRELSIVVYSLYSITYDALTKLLTENQNTTDFKLQSAMSSKHAHILVSYTQMR